MRSITAIVSALLLCLLLLNLEARGQSGHPMGGSPSQGLPPQIHPPRPREPETAEMERRMAKQRNKERWEKLRKDTDELVRLANELQKYVNQANDQVLSLQVIRKAEEIEKLAKSVKNKMKGE